MVRVMAVSSLVLGPVGQPPEDEEGGEQQRNPEVDQKGRRGKSQDHGSLLGERRRMIPPPAGRNNPPSDPLPDPLPAHPLPLPVPGPDDEAEAEPNRRVGDGSEGAAVRSAGAVVAQEERLAGRDLPGPAVQRQFGRADRGQPLHQPPRPGPRVVGDHDRARPRGEEAVDETVGEEDVPVPEGGGHRHPRHLHRGEDEPAKEEAEGQSGEVEEEGRPAARPGRRSPRRADGRGGDGEAEEEEEGGHERRFRPRDDQAGEQGEVEEKERRAPDGESPVGVAQPRHEQGEEPGQEGAGSGGRISHGKKQGAGAWGRPLPGLRSPSWGETIPGIPPCSPSWWSR